MRLAFVCTGIADNLKYLEPNKSKVTKTLESYEWKVIPLRLSSLSTLNDSLEEYRGYDIEEFIFYYSGHGDISSQNQILKLKLNHNELMPINEILDSIFEYINPTKQAVILDACYSGNYKNIDFPNNIEILCSSSERQQSFEEDELQNSIFSYYFTEAVTHYNGSVTLDEISRYIKSKTTKQTPFPIQFGDDHLVIGKSEQNSITVAQVHYDIEETPPKTKEDEKLDAIFVHFEPISGSEVNYQAAIYIQFEDEFDNETKHFEFDNIYDPNEQEKFIALLVEEFDSDVMIHLIIPQELYAINFKQWRYNSMPLVNRYNVLLHNKDNFESNYRRFKRMMKNWTSLYPRLENEPLSNALMKICDCSTLFDTSEQKIGAYFQNQAKSYEDITASIQGLAKVALWQYCDQEISITQFHQWVEGSITLGTLKESSRECKYMALLWDEMQLLDELKNIVEKGEQNG